MSSLGILLFVVFAILAAFSNAKKTGQGTGAPRRGGGPPTGWPTPRTPGELPPARAGEPPPVLVAGRSADEANQEAERAAELVPDDLWAILTGERRPSMRPPQRPLQTPHEIMVPAPAPAGMSRTEPVSLGTTSVEQSRSQLAGALDARGSSLSAAQASSPAGAAPATPAVAGGTGQAAPGQVATGRPGSLLSGPADLRRAMVLQLLLGPPKSLE